jgi:hypothetical protein
MLRHTVLTRLFWIFLGWMVAQAMLYDTPVWAQAYGIWDDSGTNSKSGVEGNMMDEGKSEGTSGVSKEEAEKIRHFYIPPVRQWENVDPLELLENKHYDYSPYANVQFSRALKIGDKTLEVGYYQVKIGNLDSGSPVHRLNTPATQPIVYGPPDDKTMATPIAVPSYPLPDPPKPFWQQLLPSFSAKPPLPTPGNTVMVIKKLGNVLAVLPVIQVLPVSKPPALPHYFPSPKKLYYGYVFKGKPDEMTGAMQVNGEQVTLQLTQGKFQFVVDMTTLLANKP